MRRHKLPRGNLYPFGPTCPRRAGPACRRPLRLCAFPCNSRHFTLNFAAGPFKVDQGRVIFVPSPLRRRDSRQLMALPPGETRALTRPSLRFREACRSLPLLSRCFILSSRSLGAPGPPFTRESPRVVDPSRRFPRAGVSSIRGEAAASAFLRNHESRCRSRSPKTSTGWCGRRPSHRRPPPRGRWSFPARRWWRGPARVHGAPPPAPARATWSSTEAGP